MATKVTFLIQLATSKATGQIVRLGGWTESYYRASDPSGVTPATITQLATRRAALLPNLASIIGYRIAQTNGVQTGATETKELSLPGVSGENQDVPQMALNIRLRADAAINSRTVVLRGIPDAQVARGVYNPSPGFTSAVNTFLTNLVNNDWRFLARRQDLPRLPIVNIDADGLLTATEATAALAAGLVQVERTLRPNGRRVGMIVRATIAAGNTLQLVNWPHGATIGGTVRDSEKLFLAYASPTPVKPNTIMVRKVGRPFDLYRGRQPA